MYINMKQIIIGAISLVVGLFVYIMDRPLEETYFLIYFFANRGILNSLPDIFGVAGNVLPAFIHVFSFILLSSGLMCCGKKGCIFICFFWLIVNVFFETGQRYSVLMLRIIPDWFDVLPFFENSRNFFLFGTFDLLDLVAVILGTVIGYIVILLTMEEGKCRI